MRPNNTSPTDRAQPRERVVFIELLRVAACFFVIVNHTVSGIFLQGEPSPLWFGSLFYFFMSKAAVPLFLMITGYTMLDRWEDWPAVLRRIVRFGLCILLFSAVYYVVGRPAGPWGAQDILTFLLTLLHGPITGAYWYLYLYLGILLMLPFLRRMAAGMERRDYHVYFLVSGLFFSLWPIVVYYLPALNYSAQLQLPLFNSYLCMLLLGGYMKRFCGETARGGGRCAAAYLVCCGVSVLLTFSAYTRAAGGYYLDFDERTLLPIVASGVFLFCAAASLRFSQRAGRLLTALGRLTFGIYLLSDLLIAKLRFIFNAMTDSGVHPMLAVVVYELAVFAVGGVLTALMKKIPLLKKLI